ncbi:hypothetical protein DXU77_17165 [Pseudomonas lactis]|nr:hypothetical protein [Pseudomonas lactis]
MLARNVNDNACFLNKRGANAFLASKLAPTKSLAFGQVFSQNGYSMGPRFELPCDYLGALARIGL